MQRVPVSKPGRTWRFSAPAAKGFLYLPAMLAVACNAFEYVPLCEQATREFHSSLNSQEYRQVLGTADEAFRSAQSVAQFESSAESNLERFGPFIDGTLTYKHVNVGAGGTVVSLQYTSEFQKGWACEELRWRIVDGVPRLLAYSIAPAVSPDTESQRASRN